MFVDILTIIVYLFVVLLVILLSYFVAIVDVTFRYQKRCWKMFASLSSYRRMSWECLCHGDHATWRNNYIVTGFTQAKTIF